MSTATKARPRTGRILARHEGAPMGSTHVIIGDHIRESDREGLRLLPFVVFFALVPFLASILPTWILEYLRGLF